MYKKPWGVLTGVRPSKIIHNYLDLGKKEDEIRTIVTEKYKLSREKANLLIEVCNHQRDFLPLPGEKGGIGVYIGIPFCPSRCYYCSFPAYQISDYHEQVKPFFYSLLEEISVLSQLVKKSGWKVETIYLGGGTPTILSDQDLELLLLQIKKNFSFNNLLEFTIEAGRPETVNKNKIDSFVKYGVTRVSINPQTMQEETLEYIGRRHTIEQILKAVKLVRNYKIPVLNMDLIIGLPGEGKKELETSIKKVLELQPENITVHTLALKRATYWKENEQKPRFLRDELIKEMVDYSQCLLREANYVPYYLYRQKNILGGLENIGYCLKGKECLYNIQMMEERNTVLGLGGGAMTKLVNHLNFSIKRKPNPKDPVVYQRNLGKLVKSKIGFLIDE